MGEQATSGGVPIEVVNAIIDLGRAYVELGVTTFAEWMAAARTDGYGREVADNRRAFRQVWRVLSESGEVPSPVHDPNDLSEIGHFAKKLLRFVVDSGVEHRDDVIDEVHAELQEVMPEITRRETMTAIVGHGKFRELSKGELSVKIRDVKGEIQQLQKVEEAKRRGGFVVTDPGRQIGPASDAAKTALRNRIADMEHEIKTREKIVKERTPLGTDAELEALRKRRDELKAVWDKVFPAKRPVRKLTDQQKLRLLGNALDREITNLISDLVVGRLGPKPKGSLVTSPEIESKRAKLDELRAVREEMRLASPEYQAEFEAKQTARYEQSLDRRLADLEDRLAAAKRGELKKTEIRKEILEKKYEIKQINDEIRAVERAAERAAKWARQTPIEKVVGLLPDALDLQRALLVCLNFLAAGFQVAFFATSHPIEAAKAMPKMFRALRRKGAFVVEEELRNLPDFRLAESAGLAITVTGGGSAQQEESYMGEYTQRKWFEATLLPASERALTTYLNWIRVKMFSAMLDTVRSDGGAVTMEEAKIVAKFVNSATGRGGES